MKNYAALKYLRDMEKGDHAFVYHTGRERQVVGIAEVTSDAYPDPNEDDEKIAVADVRALRRLEHPVPLADLKNEPAFAGPPAAAPGPPVSDGALAGAVETRAGPGWRSGRRPRFLT